MARRGRVDAPESASSLAAEVRRRLGLAPGQHGGGVSDLLVFATNLLFLTPLPQGLASLVQRSIGGDDPAAGRQLALLLGAVVVLQAVGAFLKRRPLQARLGEKAGANPLGCAATWLLLFNYILSLLILVTIVALVPALNDAEPWSAMAVMVIAAVPTYLVYRALSPVKPGHTPSVLDSPPVEWVADLCLLTYVVANTMFFNFLTAFKASPPASLGEVVNHLLSLFVVLAIVLLWYLPPRLLFLVEDFRHPGTWWRMALVMAPIAFRWVVG
jgi:hypothetical protein